MKNNYKDLAEYVSACSRARSARDQARQQLSIRWAMITAPAMRRALLKNALGDMLRSWSPYRRVQALLNGSITGSTVAAIGVAVASTKQGLGRRLLLSGLSLLAGRLIGR